MDKVNELEKTQDTIVYLKKKMLDTSINVNRTIVSNKDEFSQIDIFIDHFDALKKHVQNTHLFLLKQLSAVKLNL